jgi:hypothetical protein
MSFRENMQSAWMSLPQIFIGRKTGNSLRSDNGWLFTTAGTFVAHRPTVPGSTRSKSGSISSRSMLLGTERSGAGNNSSHQSKSTSTTSTGPRSHPSGLPRQTQSSKRAHDLLNVSLRRDTIDMLHSSFCETVHTIQSRDYHCEHVLSSVDGCALPVFEKYCVHGS